MIARDTQYNLGGVLFVSSTPNDISNNDLVREKTFEFAESFGNGTIKDCFLEDMHFMEMDLLLNQKVAVTNITLQPVLELLFNLEGYYEEPSKSEYQIAFPATPCTHNILYSPSFEGKFEHATASNKKRHTFEIHLSHDYFYSLLSTGFPLAEKFMHAMQQNDFTAMHSQSPPITIAMSHVINDIKNCNKKGPLKKLFYETRILDLLLLQLEQVQCLHEQSSDLSRYDRERLQEAKCIVEANIDDPFSLSQLSRKVGINEFKLKKGFKELFGCTVFGYIHDLRMAEAKKMLQESRHSIGEIAGLVGYKNTQHFSAAFKRTYGFLPSHIFKSRPL